MDTPLSAIDLQARTLAQKYDVITLNFKGMLAPKAPVTPGPYAAKEDLDQALHLAKEKHDYLFASQDETKNRDPASFLDLRDGGTDTQGEPGNPIMTGWLVYAEKTLAKKTFLEGLQKAGEKIRRDFQALLVIGIGGSYTDIEGTLSALNPLATPIPVYYLGQHLSAEQYQRFFRLVEKIKGRVAVNIISKSGTTVEPALAARIVLEKLVAMKKLGAVFATTDPRRGALREVVNLKDYNPSAYLDPETGKDFYIGEDIGGRYSCITPVGLLPFAAAGIDLKEILLGYHYAIRFLHPVVVEGAAFRHAAYQAGATLAVLSYNLACFRGKILALRQLWPESSGKNGQGLNIMEEFYTADAHSNGQLIKSGIRNLMEIFYFIDDPGIDFSVPVSEHDSDKLNAVAGSTSLHTINNRFMGALLLDHYHSGVPVIAVRIPKLTPFHVGMLTGTEHLCTAIFGLMLGINPVNQPGVQGYKDIAFRLLGLKGPDAQAQALAQLNNFGI